MKNQHDVIIRLIVSEKVHAGRGGQQVHVPQAPSASKPEIRDAVEAIFGVRVTSVNTLNRKGKSVRNRRTNQMSKRADEKRAVVTLAEGDEIDLFGS